MSGQRKLFINYAACIGCETCEFVCRFANETPRIHMARTRDGLMVPLYCHHCADPHCAKACKRGAIAADGQGVVLLDTMACRACDTRLCIQACPYAAMFETDKGAMTAKCDLCANRRKAGLEPACAEMCPTGAILFATPEEIRKAETPETQAAADRVLALIRGK